ncbi:MAG: FHA domain-containing protein [Mobiluncus porci]|uniref:FHA domain-containing protein n=1 Tax=Mobiluncus porci TaxID=2652278 RepID=A0A7K0K093_9ACTO|nr:MULTISPECIES: FHA domain-containing protein [Mobiluncus]MCI6585377.1 FHA domain-containing protein [Mobiluncus sp.]MDD7541414.1 FHA domain-containing protein [Mobiluncus porci]MDY5748399.1 FHA domain-containing protein [Mobiluncus porci]MST48844.1 FHA domain-containing protein [Mobiluncus porci]
MSDIGASAPDETAVFGAIGTLAESEPELGKRVLSPADEEAVAALPAGSALLIVQRGPSAGARFLLDTDRITAGRHPRSDIFLDDVTVSRKHCEFLREGEGFVVRDVGSLNGTYVDRQRVESHLLQSGEEVQIGKFRLAYYPAVVK